MFLNTFDLLIDDDFTAGGLSFGIKPAEEDAERIAKAGDFIAAATLPDDGEVSIVSNRNGRRRLFVPPFDVGQQHIARRRVMRILAIEDSIGIIVAITGVNDDSIALRIDGQRGGLLIARLEARDEVVDELFLGGAIHEQTFFERFDER